MIIKKLALPAEILNHFTTKEIQSLLRLRRDLHQYPELAFQEVKTQKRLKKELKKLKPLSIKEVAGTGLIARIKGKNPKAPIIAIRSDIDALPIQENTRLSYKSKHPGIMHACGHDVHASWAIGAAMLLSKNPAEGDVLIVLQPAEEIAKGAKAILDSGALKEASFILGGHVDRRFPVPQVVCQDGYIAANSDTFIISFTGKSSHGARPEEGLSPLPSLKELLETLPKLEKSLRTKTEPCVISIGEIHAGTSHNICPGDVTIRGTIRSLSKEKQKKLHNQLKESCQKIAKKQGVKATVNITKGAPAIHNDRKLIQVAKKELSPIIGSKNCITLPKLNMGSEDFGEYLKKIPGCFFRIGARTTKSKFIPAHSPEFYVEDESIFLGTVLFATLARKMTQIRNL